MADFGDFIDELVDNLQSELPSDLIVGDIGEPVARTTLVYRIEMPNGEGPYNSHLPNADAIYEHLCNPLKGGFDCAHLAKHEQAGITEAAFHEAHGHADYGCDSLEAIGNWFPDGAREYLKTLDAVLVVYELHRGQYLLRIGAAGEVVFDRHSTFRRQTLDVVSFEETDNG